MSSGRSTPAYPVGELLGFAMALFRGAGLDPDKAGTVAEILVEGDLLGHSTHGLALAAPYLAALDAGSMTRAIRSWSPTAAAACAGTAGDYPGPGSWSGDRAGAGARA
jgi:L-lactate dehydrogenase